VGHLSHWCRQILPRLDPHFRMVMVAGLDQVNSTIHIRPVVDGCHLLDSVYTPLALTDYRKLRISPRFCRLNGTTLKVAFNQVLLLTLIESFLIFVVCRLNLTAKPPKEETGLK